MNIITLDNHAIVNNDCRTNSLIVADIFGKRHDNVLRNIESLEIDDNYRLLNFEETVVTRDNPSGGGKIKSKAYTLTRDGFVLLAMGFTGKKAMQFKIKFLEAFNAMERALMSQPQPKAIAQPKCITKEQKADITNAIYQKVKDSFIEIDNKKKVQEASKIYDALKKHYNVNAFKFIPYQHYQDSMDFVQKFTFQESQDRLTYLCELLKQETQIVIAEIFTNHDNYKKIEWSLASLCQYSINMVENLAKSLDRKNTH